MATVVTKLLNLAGADQAYFGEKDWQQLQIIKALAHDLDIPTEIVSVPIVREPDGVAMSSRNVRLTPEQRAAALVLSPGLDNAQAIADTGVQDAYQLAAWMRQTIEVRRWPAWITPWSWTRETLQEIDTIENGAVASSRPRSARCDSLIPACYTPRLAPTSRVSGGTMTKPGGLLDSGSGRDSHLFAPASAGRDAGL